MAQDFVTVMIDQGCYAGASFYMFAWLELIHWIFFISRERQEFLFQTLLWPFSLYYV